MSKRCYIKRTPDMAESVDCWNVYDRNTRNDLNDCGHDCVDSYLTYEQAVRVCARLNGEPEPIFVED